MYNLVMKKSYNKLVRDNIIDIIKNDNKKCSYRILDDNEYFKCLNQKLIEEHQEYNENYSIEELADMQEVIDAILKFKGISKRDFEEIKLKKSAKNGSFDKKIFLIDVEDE